MPGRPVSPRARSDHRASNDESKTVPDDLDVPSKPRAFSCAAREAPVQSHTPRSRLLGESQLADPIHAYDPGYG
jgi:hypothetical protein